jgi:hypothetical protein
MISSTPEPASKAKDEALTSALDERARRLWAATEALRLGPGGIATVARAPGLAASTVRLGQQELTSPAQVADAPRRLRRPGAGRQSLPTAAQTLRTAVAALVEPTTRGAPLSPLRWTWKRTRRLATALGPQGHPVSPRNVGQRLQALNSRWHGTRNTREGASPPDRNAQLA